MSKENLGLKGSPLNQVIGEGICIMELAKKMRLYADLDFMLNKGESWYGVIEITIGLYETKEERSLAQEYYDRNKNKPANEDLGPLVTYNEEETSSRLSFFAEHDSDEYQEALEAKWDREDR